jgi:hypothetical protein
MDDVRAVMTWSPRGLVLWSGTEGSRTTTLFAASPRVHDRPRRLNLSIKGAAHRRYPWAPSDATWRETLLFSSDQRGSAEFCAGARGRGRATRLSTMRGRVHVGRRLNARDDEGSREGTVGKLPDNDQSDQPVGPGGTLEFPLGCRLGGNFRLARASGVFPITHREVESGLLMRYTSEDRL